MNVNQTFKWKKLSLGVCYYPEHWNNSLWEEDLRRMQKVGIHTIRIAEFAWSKFEPTEGQFTFDFFDKFMLVVEKVGMKVIFGTPTATPPAWLTEKYPEALNETIEGVLYRHGGRRHYNYNSFKYQELSTRIVEQIAKHYGQHQNVIGWQIDNEMNCEKDVFYSESDTLAFRSYLQQKYETLEALNDAWGTVFWNQTYTDWTEVSVPRKTIQVKGNPHQELDFTRFISESAIHFCRIQSEIIRKYSKKEDFITTNGMFGNLDNHKMEKECLDVYTFDSYPNFAYCLGEAPKSNKGLNDRNWSDKLTEVRSICPHFGIMEQQSGANGWNSCMEGPAPKPGQMTLWTMQSIAHGADYISYFRWRTSIMGTEIYWHGILDYDNRDNRKLAEIQNINDRIHNIEELTGADYIATVAVVRDYDNVWDSKLDVWHGRLENASSNEIFVAAQQTHTPYDYIYLQEDTELEELLKYKVVFYPHAAILTEKRTQLLEQYVGQGGCLILGCRTGYKDDTGKCVMTPMPGLATDLTGANVEEFTLIGPNDDAVYMDWDGNKLETPIMNDILEPITVDTKVLGTYTDNYYKGKPALLEHPYGLGRVIYFGSVFTRDNVEAFLNYTGVIHPFKDYITAPKECEIIMRQKGKVKFMFVLNFAHGESAVILHREVVDMDTLEKASGIITLAAYGTKVYKINI